MADKKSNMHVFRNVFWEHVLVSPNLVKHQINTKGVSETARLWVQYMSDLRKRSIDLMRNREEIELVQTAKLYLYGELYGPSWEYLYTKALSDGRAPGEDACLAVIEWVLRTHDPPAAKNRWYKAVLEPAPAFRLLLETVIHWTRNDDLFMPWICGSCEQDLRIRLGDFPVEHLYHVFSGPEKLGVVDDWPLKWTREPWIATLLTEPKVRRPPKRLKT